MNYFSIFIGFFFFFFGHDIFFLFALEFFYSALNKKLHLILHKYLNETT